MVEAKPIIFETNLGYRIAIYLISNPPALCPTKTAFEIFKY